MALQITPEKGQNAPRELIRRDQDGKYFIELSDAEAKELLRRKVKGHA